MENTFKNISDHQRVPHQWKGSTIKVFVKALTTYRELLAPHLKIGNEEIMEENKTIRSLIIYMREELKSWSSDSDINELLMEGSSYKLLSDVLHKYFKLKERDLEEKRKVNVVKGALEKEEKEVESIRSVISSPIFQQIERRSTLVPHFHTGKNNVSDDKTKKPRLQQQISIGNLYGQAVFGDNFGQLYQGTTKELLTNLQELFQKITDSKELSQEVKGDAFGDIQTIQAQVMKTNPDKSILTKAKDSLSTLADAAQVGRFSITAAPHITKIIGFIAELFT